MKTFKSITSLLLGFTTGVTIRSLLITDSESWKYALPIFMILITIRIIIEENKDA